MKLARSFCLLMALVLLLAACQSTSTQSIPTNRETPSVTTPTAGGFFAETPISPTQTTEAAMTAKIPSSADAFAMNTLLGRGINLGNALEAPNEGDWGVTLEADYFKLIKAKGFSTVRVPIRWSTHADLFAPYTIDPKFFARIDWVIEQARANNLFVIIDMHHYEEIHKDPQGNRERFMALWQQIATHYKDAPDSVLFELLNEPNGDKLNAQVWNDLLRDTLVVVRETNPNRFIVIGPAGWNSVDNLKDLKLPEQDRRIIATFHYYTPFKFTHQGAEWTSGSNEWMGTQWTASEAERAEITRDFEKAVRWSEKNQRPILLGEFGAYSKADMESRARWTSYVTRLAEADGFSWTYWEFCAGFGIYNRQDKTFYTPLVDALIPAP